MATCRLLGHRPQFRSEGRTLIWDCARGCGAGGSRTYATPEAAARYARALDDDGRESLGRRAPLIGLLPLRLWRMAKDRRRP